MEGKQMKKYNVAILGATGETFRFPNYACWLLNAAPVKK